MFSLIGKFIGGLIGAALTSVWDRFFPPKTAADQKVEDLSQTVKDAEHANEISQQVSQEPLSTVQSDLDKRVRDPSA